eukprot:270738-Ditylum_brightwellii.AAC.1
MDKGLDVSSRILKDFIKTSVCYEECKGQMPTTNVTACKDPPEKVKKCKAKCKLDSDYSVWDRVPYQHHMDGSQYQKKVHFQHNNKYKAKLCGLFSKEIKDMNTFMDSNIANIIDCCKKKKLAVMNKFKALSISSGSNDDIQSSNCEVKHISGEESDSK